jgi:hypothetical protein
MQPSFGALESVKDKRTVKAKSLTLATTPFVKGGVDYSKSEIENQHAVGICTAISFIQNMEKANSKKYSPDFQYLLQKKYYDFNWIEGSSILSALKVGKRYGLLPIEHFTHITVEDRKLGYQKYVAKLQAISEQEIQRLLTLCVDKIPGYASVDRNDDQEIAEAINESKAGVLCRYDVGKEWWTNPICPLRPPVQIISGHAVTNSSFDYSVAPFSVVTNTWGGDWAVSGSCKVNLNSYRPTEVWVIVNEPLIVKFNINLKFLDKCDEVTNLQNALKIKGFFNYDSTGFFGLITLSSVRAFQKYYSIPATGFVGPLTRAKLNLLFGVQ